MDPNYDAMPVESGKVRRGDETIASSGDTICGCTDAIRRIPVEDSQILQDGNVFKAEVKLTLAPETEVFLVFETPVATEEIPLYVVWGTDVVKGDVNNIDYTLWENATWTGGIAQPAINPNRPLKAVSVSQTLLFNTTTAGVSLVGATEIDLDAVLGGQGGPGISQTSSGEVAAGLRFIVCEHSTKHALRLYNNDPDNTANIVVKSAYLEALFPRIWALSHP